MASLSDRNQNAEMLGVRTAPRPSASAPVLFRLPNLRVDAAHRPTRENASASAVAVGPPPSNQNTAVPQATQPVDTASSIPTTPTTTTPSYTPVPVAGPIGTESATIKKSWYASWSNRLIVGGLICLISFFAYRAMRQPNQDVAGRIMQEQGMTDESLVQEVKLPPPQTLSVEVASPEPTIESSATPGLLSTKSDTSPTLIATAPSLPQEASEWKNGEPAKEGKLDAPMLDFGNPTSTSKPTQRKEESPTPSLLGANSQESRPQTSVEGSSNRAIGANLTSSLSLDKPLEPPQLEPAPADSRTLSNASDNNARFPSIAASQPADDKNVSRAETPSSSPTMSETQFEGLSTEALLAARRERLPQIQSALANVSPSTIYRTASSTSSPALQGQGNRPAYQPIYDSANATANADSIRPSTGYKPIGSNLAESYASNPNYTPLTGQSYPPSTENPPGITLPISGPVGPAISGSAVGQGQVLQGQVGQPMPTGPSGQGAPAQGNSTRAPYQPIGTTPTSNPISPSTMQQLNPTNGWGAQQQPLYAPAQPPMNGYGAAVSNPQNAPMSYPNTMAPQNLIPSNWNAQYNAAQSYVQGVQGMVTTNRPQLQNPNTTAVGGNAMGLIPGTQPYVPPSQQGYGGAPYVSPTGYPTNPVGAR